MVRCDYEVLPEDIAAFRLHVAARPALRRAAMLRYLLLLAVLPAGVLLIAWIAGGLRPLRLTPGTLVPVAMPSLLGLAVMPFFGMMRRSAARRGAILQVAGRAKGVLTGPVSLGISAEGVSVRMPAVTSLYGWEVIEGVEETPTHLFIVLGPWLGIVVPKRGLDAATVAAVAAAIAARIARRDLEAAKAVEAPDAIREAPAT